MSDSFKPYIRYINGYNVAPYEIDPLGNVLFTNGTIHNIVPSEKECRAYGYTYDSFNQVCRINQQYNSKITQNMYKGKNTQIGTDHIIEKGVVNTIIGGQNNEVRGFAKNNIISGEGNYIDNSLKNTVAIGVNGTATRQSEFVKGGGVNLQTYVEGDERTLFYYDRQMSLIQLSGTTTDNTATNLTVNGDGTNYINVKNNSIVGYEIYMTRFEQGGSNGTAGNFSYRNLKGVARIDDSYNMIFIVGMTRNIAKYDSGGGSGVNGSFSMVDSSTTDVKSMTIQVSDRNNVQNLWSASVYIHELISTNVTF